MNGLEEISSENSDSIRKLLLYGTLCCDSSVAFENGKEQHIGDPTETAIIVAAHKNGMTKNDLNHQYPRLAEIPFDSALRVLALAYKEIDIIPG